MTKLPTAWREVRSEDGALLYYQRICGGYRVVPLYSGRWHACERLTGQGEWLEWAGKERLLDALSVCGAHALAQSLPSTKGDLAAAESCLSQQ